MSRGEPETLIFRRGADEGEFVRSRSAKASPDTDGLQVSDAGHISASAFDHSGEDAVVHFGPLRVKLPRGSENDLSGATRLHVERDGIGGDGMCALQITEFHQLMTHESWIAVGDDKVAFALADGQSRD